MSEMKKRTYNKKAKGTTVNGSKGTVSRETVTIPELKTIETPLTEEDTLPVVEEATEINPADFARLMADKDVAINNYMTTLDNMRKEYTALSTHYNEDMSYMAELNANVVKNFRTKEDAINKIIEGAMTLMTLDRKPLAPERKEG